ncbi:MAG: 50S ribosomal protein L29 [Firmicutes bacterium]|jgi:large subunit ribosomal protein L29|nr:50S ribosomal protein L29 [Candidatus Fermentithermobacillaceae bacterium]HON87635.1 50S ribosomal protein L29 [Bacillota bacterium]HOV65480.1 50S ribosomal protein L29 [Bacillota bacterium]
MKVQEIRAMSDTDLNRTLLDLKDELFNLRFQLATGQLDNVMRISEVKRSIARVKTIQRQRELGRLAQEG